MLLPLCRSVDVQETLARFRHLASPEVLLLGGFDGLDIMSHGHSYSEEDDVTATQM